MNYTISTDKTKLDIPLIHTFLTTSYWAEGRTLETVAASIQGSLCFGVYQGDVQVGFARVITDYAVFACLADVFVVSEHRGNALGKKLVQTVLSYPELRACNWTLFTKDAHGLYESFGFERSVRPERLMRRRAVEVLPLS